ncbi:MAG: helicase C-terminal domain-containing protein [Dehalococcoidia bacterium]
MTRTYVALDIETTGLDLDRDKVTEVGAVRFDEHGNELAVYESLINPGRDIPAFVTSLTGISDKLVRGAPALAAAAPKLVEFVGDSIVVGQNIGFDLAHLRKGGVEFPQLTAIDTAELSRVLLPLRQPRGLDDLAALLEIDAPTAHRALADARTAARVFGALQQRARSLDDAVRLQLARLVSIHNLPLAEVIAGEVWESVPITERALPVVRPAPDLPSLQRREPPVPIAQEPVRRVFAAGPGAIPGFEARGPQVDMTDAVTTAFAEGGHYLVEAGTGVGKSLAYLVPAAIHALTNGERVVVTTNTINLQEQLYQKDIPALRAMLVAAGVIEKPEDLRAAVLKGRANYLCLRRWTASYASGLGDPDFAKLGSTMLLWLPETETGDRSELSIDHTDYVTWQRFSAQDTDCLQRQSIYVRNGQCFLQRARKAAESAHILIVNHALLLADLAAGGSALPAFDHLIIDEAHNLEDQATNQFGGAVSLRLLRDALDGLHRPASRNQREGGVASLLKSLPEGAAFEAGLRLEAAVQAVGPMAIPAFERLATMLPGEGEDDRIMVDRALRAQPGWSDVEASWMDLDKVLGTAHARALSAAQTLAGDAPVEEPDALSGEVESAARKLEELRLRLADLVTHHDDQQVVWLARERDTTAAIHGAPLDVGPLLWEDLFQKKRTVVATSATLAAAGGMAYTARRLGFQDPGMVQLGSPFDYRWSSLLCAADDLADPSRREFDEDVARAIVELATASDGRALALFTSHAAMRRAAQLARRGIEDAGLLLMVQGIDGQPRQLTDHLRNEPRSVVFGTSSFWEGVDIKGEALSMLIITRLPFAVPTDPIHRARSAQYDDPFGEYSLPSAILKFRQGFGRLIRDRRDRGVVAVLDRRIFEKRYGDQFVKALPQCTTLKAGIETIARRSREWLQMQRD